MYIFFDFGRHIAFLLLFSSHCLFTLLNNFVCIGHGPEQSKISLHNKFKKKFDDQNAEELPGLIWAHVGSVQIIVSGFGDVIFLHR